LKHLYRLLFSSPRHNHYDPQEYQAAYRYIGKLRKAGVNNFAYVWHSHSHKLNSPIQDWYPGDDYVDWGVSLFSQHAGMIKPTDRFAEEKGRPLMIAEATLQGK
jgi:beta-mannanase